MVHSFHPKRPSTTTIANLSCGSPTEQRRRTIGAVENVVVLPPRGLKPKPNPSYTDLLAPLSLPANVQPKKLIASLSPDKTVAPPDEQLACSVPAPDVSYRIAVNRHRNECLRLEHIQETILEAVNHSDEDGDKSDTTDRTLEDNKPLVWTDDREVVTRDDTNLARDFNTTYRFNGEVAVPVSEMRTEPGSTESVEWNSDGDESTGLRWNQSKGEVGSWTSQGMLSVMPCEMSFKASPILSFALEQTRTFLSHPCADPDSLSLHLPDAVADFQLREEDFQPHMRRPTPSGVSTQNSVEKMDDLGLCIGNVTLDDV